MGAVVSCRRWLMAVLTVGIVLLMAVPVAQGATPPCRVRNVTQDTFGRSLIRMVERARDRDELRVRGTCPGEIVIGVDVVIRGRGDDPTLSGRRRTRVVRVSRGAIVTIQGLTIRRGYVSTWTGGILNRGRLTMVGSTVRGNGQGGIGNGGRLTIRHSVIRRNKGGAIQNGRRLTLINSSVRHNSGGYAGGVHNADGATLEVVGSIIKANSGLFGGGLQNQGAATLRDSTISGNRVHHDGGGIFNGEPGSSENGDLTLIGTTVTENVADHQGGGIYNWNGSALTLDAASSVTGNIPDDCVGTPAC